VLGRFLFDEGGHQANPARKTRTLAIKGKARLPAAVPGF